MRITHEQAPLIREEVRRNIGADARVWLFGSVLAFMEKLRVLDSSEHWKLIRELRNAVNHEYGDDTAKLAVFFSALVSETSALLGYFERITAFCGNAYVGR